MLTILNLADLSMLTPGGAIRQFALSPAARERIIMVLEQMTKEGLAVEGKPETDEQEERRTPQ